MAAYIPPSPPCPMMEELFTDSPKKSYTPVSFFVNARKNAQDPNGRYIVTAVSHYKQRSPWPNLQPEYLALRVQPPPEPPQPALAPVLIKISRDPLASRPSRYRLWGATDDRVTILGPAANVELRDERLHHLRWSPNEAPPLVTIAIYIHFVHILLPPNCIWLDTCCYAYVHTLIQAVHHAFNGIPGVLEKQMLIPISLLVAILPGSTIPIAGTRKLVNELATETGVSPGIIMEGVDKWYSQRLSGWAEYIFAWIMPIRGLCIPIVAFYVTSYKTFFKTCVYD